MGYRDRCGIEGPKRLLALDGGGIRGLITLGALARIEEHVRVSSGDPDLVLGDYFDYIAGTSTGAIIATALARGMSVEQVVELYTRHGAAMFVKQAWWRRFWAKYRRSSLAEMLQSVFGEDTLFGDEELRCLLMVVLRNATTDSAWPLSNNPQARYADPDRPDSNLRLPLWQLVRGSTAAPVYFAPERIRIGQRDMLFVDGGLTLYNNPAFKLFLMATLPEYRLKWQPGEDRMLIVSVGTGSTAKPNERLREGDMNLLFNAATVPAALMYAAAVEQDALCRVFGRCRFGGELDRELGSLQNADPDASQKSFAYVRYDIDLSAAGLESRGLTGIRPKDVQRLDSVEHIADLLRVGKALAQDVQLDHFSGFLPSGVR